MRHLRFRNLASDSLRRSRLYRLIAVLCAVFLLGAQQAAYAHFLSHLGTAAVTVAQEDGDAGHAAASALAHGCTTCAAFSAVGAGAPLPSPSPLFSVAAVASLLPADDIRRPAVGPSPPYGARAPPAIL